MEIEIMSIKTNPSNQKQILPTKTKSSQPKPTHYKKPKQYPPLSKETLERLEKWEQEEQKQWFRNGLLQTGKTVLAPFSKAKESMSKWSWFWGPTVR
jgi:hypothetical protein